MFVHTKIFQGDLHKVEVSDRYAINLGVGAKNDVKMK